MTKSTLTPRERLQREEQPSRSSIANLIVIGASAGGHGVLVEILKSFSVDMPAAIVILLHMPLEADFGLKSSLGRFSHLRMIEVKNQEALQQGCIFIPPPGKSATFVRGLITVERGIPVRPVSTINASSLRPPRILASASSGSF